MNVAIGQSINAEIYLEDDYSQSLTSQYLEQVNSLDWTSWFQNWLIYLSDITDIPQECELSLKLTSDRQIQKYNRQYRDMDKPTDVLAFAAMESELVLPDNFAEPIYLGDIIISLDTAICQAIEQKHPLTVELAWLSTHGLLHLLGWDHPDSNSLERMLAQQGALIEYVNTLHSN